MRLRSLCFFSTTTIVCNPGDDTQYNMEDQQQADLVELCRAAIQERLSVQEENPEEGSQEGPQQAHDPDDLLAMLRSMEVRRLPPKLPIPQILASAKETSESYACYNMTGSPPSWTAHQRCQRCEAINQLQHSDYSESKQGEVDIASAILTTDCAAEHERLGSVRSLPTELIDMILEHALRHLDNLKLDQNDDVEPPAPVRTSRDCLFSLDALPDVMPRATPKVTYPTEDYAAIVPWTQAEREAASDLWKQKVEARKRERHGSLRALLHTSKRLRRMVAKDYPVRVHVPAARSSYPVAKLQTWVVHEAFQQFLIEAVNWYMLDFSIRPEQPPALPKCREEILTLPQLQGPRSVRVEVTVMDTIYIEPGTSQMEQVNGHAQSDAIPPSQSVTVRDACTILIQALRQVLPPPLEASPYWQIAHTDDTSVNLAVVLTLPEFGRASKRVWIFRASENKRNAEADITLLAL